MKRKICAFIATVLLISFTLNIAASGIDPLADAVTSLNGFVCENGTLETDGDGVRLNVSAEGASISFKLPEPINGGEINNLSIVMSNISACEEAEVIISTSDGAQTKYALPINSFTRRVTYSLPLDEYEIGADARIVFKNISSGAVCIYSVCGISIFDDSFDSIGAVADCEYKPNAVTLRGTLKHDTVIKHENATMSVYSLDPNQSLQDILSGNVAPKLENVPISMRFELSVKTESVFDRLKRYAVAIVSDDGKEISLVAPPRYPTVSSSALNGEIFKGIESSVTSGIIDSGAGLCILDVDTELLISSNSGYMLSVDGEGYFFDRAYVSELDAKIKVLSGGGTDVVLRLSGLPESYDIKTQKEVYAVAKFLSSRYCGDSLGTVAGFVVGSRINECLSAEHSFVEYLAAYYNTLYGVLAAANDANHPVGIIISVSDSWGTKPTPTSVSADFFIEELFKICNYYSFPPFSIMPEITSSPRADAGYIEGSGDVANPEERAASNQRALLSDIDKITLDNISSVSRTISDISKKYVDDSTDIIYLWRPDISLAGTEMAAAYVLEFYTLYFETNVRSFVVSVSGDSSEQIKKINDLKYKMRYIDTDRSLEVGDFAREVFGIKSEWSEKFIRFSEEALACWDLRDTLTPHNGVLPEIMGTYAYWDFGESSNRGGWYTGLNCASVSVGNVEKTGRVLAAKMTPGQVGEYSILAYDYENEESFRYNDYLIVEFALDSESQSDNFEINFMVGGESFRYEYKGDGYSPGKTYKVCLDVSSMTEQNPAEYLRLCVRNLSNSESQYSFLLHSVSAASTDATNDELADLIHEERDRITGDGDNESENGIDVFWIAVIAAVVILTAAVMVMISKKNHTRPEDRV